MDQGKDMPSTDRKLILLNDMKRSTFCFLFLFCFIAFSAYSDVAFAQEQEGPLWQKKRQERKDTLETRQNQRADRRQQIRDDIQQLVVVGKKEREERKKLKARLTRGEGVNLKKKFVRLELPFVSQQHDGWSCGLHTATRLLKYNKYDVSYDGLRKERQLTTLYLDSDKGPFTLPHALQRILRKWHQKSWWMTDVEFDVVKNLLRQKKPVATLIAVKGQTAKVNMGSIKLEAPLTHWVVVSGFNDLKKIVYYYDPLKEGEQQTGYEEFLDVWATKPEDSMGDSGDPLLLVYGLLTSRTIGFCY